MREYSEKINTTMCDFKSFYIMIANTMPDGAKLVECGVADSKSAIFLCERLADLNKNFHLTMVENMAYGGYNQMNTIWRHVHNSGLAESIEILPKDSVAASQHFNDQSIDFLFLDTSHEFEETLESIIAWFPKMKHGSKIAGHDYHLYEGVREAVNELLPDATIIDTAKNYGVWSIEITPELKLGTPQPKELKKKVPTPLPKKKPSWLQKLFNKQP